MELIREDFISSLENKRLTAKIHDNDHQIIPEKNLRETLLTPFLLVKFFYNIFYTKLEILLFMRKHHAIGSKAY